MTCEPASASKQQQFQGTAVKGLGGGHIEGTSGWVALLLMIGKEEHRPASEKHGVQAHPRSKHVHVMSVRVSRDEHVRVQRAPTLPACSPVSPPQQRQSGVTTPEGPPEQGWQRSASTWTFDRGVFRFPERTCVRVHAAQRTS